MWSYDITEQTILVGRTISDLAPRPPQILSKICRMAFSQYKLVQGHFARNRAIIYWRLP